MTRMLCVAARGAIDRAPPRARISAARSVRADADGTPERASDESSAARNGGGREEFDEAALDDVGHR